MNTQFYRFRSRTYSTRHALFALLCLILGCFISEHMPFSSHPMAAFIGANTFLTTALIIIKLTKKRLSAVCLWCSLIALLLSGGMILSGSAGIITLSFWAQIATVCYMVSAEYGNRIEPGFSNYIGLDVCRSLILPFRALPALFDALLSSFTGKSFRNLGKILLGIAIAVIPTIIIAVLLSFDSSYTEVMNNIFSFRQSVNYSQIPKYCIGILIGACTFGLFIAAKAGYHKGDITPECCKTKQSKMQLLPQLTALTAALPILFIYGVYFFSQWQYYISGFTGILPESFSYAQYAREGFFQLCTVCVINLIIIISFSLFLRRGLNGKAPVLKILTCTFCVCTLILMATAVAKLVMYIDMYGMTQKRLLAMWAMIVIALVFIAIAIGQFLPRIKTGAICLFIVLSLFLVLCLCNTNGLIAQYNVDRYLSGTLETLDIDAMKELGISAVPALSRIAESSDSLIDPNLQWRITAYLERIAQNYQEDPFNILNYSIPDYMAMQALKMLGLM